MQRHLTLLNSEEAVGSHWLQDDYHTRYMRGTCLTGTAAVGEVIHSSFTAFRHSTHLEGSL